MNARIKPQIIEQDGKPAFVVIPYDEWVSLNKEAVTEHLIPHGVMSRIVKEEMTAIKAWREHLGHTQIDIANKLAISQSAYAQIEASKRPQKATKRKIADALGIRLEQLDI